MKSIEKDCSSDFLDNIRSDIEKSNNDGSKCEIKRIYVTGTDIKELNAYSTNIYYILMYKSMTQKACIKLQW